MASMCMLQYIEVWKVWMGGWTDVRTDKRTDADDRNTFQPNWLRGKNEKRHCYLSFFFEYVIKALQLEFCTIPLILIANLSLGKSTLYRVMFGWNFGTRSTDGVM